jgi:ABC-2 type transport system ATP-binding protein
VPAIELAGIARDFGRGRRRVHALADVELAIPEGQTIGILGDNGAGKTTLLRIISTLLLPSAGRVRVCGIDAVARPEAARDLISVTFGGDRGLYRRLTGRQNLDFFATLRGMRGRAATRVITAAIDRVGLAEAADRRVETYSRGMRQRLHLAIGTLVLPRVLLLDEPTVGLDPIEAGRVRRLVAEIGKAGSTIVLTSHLLRDVELLATRILMLQDGRLRHDLSTREFLQQAGTVGAVVLSSVEPIDAVTAAPIGPLISSEPTTGGWTSRIAVTDWSPAVLAALGRVSEIPGIETVSIEKVSLDDVYEALATGPVA